jgi:hypothetical protein
MKEGVHVPSLPISDAHISCARWRSPYLNVALELDSWASHTNVAGFYLEENFVELHPICLPVGLPVSVSYQPSSVGIFGIGIWY